MVYDDKMIDAIKVWNDPLSRKCKVIRQIFQNYPFLENLHIEMMLSSPNLNRINWEAIFNALQRSRCRLEKLDVSYNGINDGFALSLSNALHRHNTTLKTLDLSGFSNHYDPDENIDDNMTLTGWRVILLPLQDQSSALQELNLSDQVFFNDEVIYTLYTALEYNTTLRILDLSNNTEVTTTAWVTFSAILWNRNSPLTKLDLSGNQTSDDLMIAFAETLINNRKMKELRLVTAQGRHQSSRGVVTAIGYAAFVRILCNDSSIMNTYQSNHTLEKLGWDDYYDFVLPDDIECLLQLNRENSVSDTARLKVIKTHFSGRDINMQPFEDMKVEVLDGNCLDGTRLEGRLHL
jgi:hypothetical protein